MSDRNGCTCSTRDPWATEHRELCPLRPRSSSMEYIRRYYDVPADVGLTVTVDGKPGRITSARNSYIWVRFDGESFSKPCHPTWRVEYELAKPREGGTDGT